MIKNISKYIFLIIAVSLNFFAKLEIALAGGVDTGKVAFLIHDVPLNDGHYLREEFVDRKAGTYSLSKWWESPLVFSEFDVKRTTGGYKFEGGNLHEGLISFSINKKGYVESEPINKPGVIEHTPCFQKFCISSIRVLNDKSFSIIVNDKEQKFMSVEGLKRIEPIEKK